MPTNKPTHQGFPERAQRIIAAVKELHEACYDAWEQDDDVAFRTAWVVLSDMLFIAICDGDEIQGWSGGCIKQSDTLLQILGVLKHYGADKKETA